MPFVKNGDAIKSLFEELQARDMYTNDIPVILVLYRQYHKAEERMARKNSAQGKASLTERENEIARLVVQGLSNK